MADPNVADRFIFTSLAADSALTAIVGGKIYNEIATPTTPPVAPPYVLYQMQSAVGLRTIGVHIVWSNMLFLVRGVVEANSYTGASKTMADRIETVLHAASGSNIDGVLFACVWENPFRLPEIADGRILRHQGAMFRIYARGA